MSSSPVGDALMTPLENIRNFSIIAHIDHGKSTLADRLIQFCGGLTEREMKEQVLDNMDIERERGITIKAQTVRLNYRARDGKDYVLNLMDTPGHVDFAYEVSRSLAACEGSLLVVDASQGVEAQTLANVYQAIEVDHEIVPVLNKIDLPAAEPERVRDQIEEVIGLDASDAVQASAKSGIGIEDVLESLVNRLPAPQGATDAPLKAMLVDSWYDPYLGVMTLVRVRDGVLKKGMKIRMMATGAVHHIERVGVFSPNLKLLTASARAKSGLSMPGSSRSPIRVLVIPSPMTASRRNNRCPGSNPRFQSFSAVFSRLMPVSLPICVRRWKSSASMTVHSLLRRKHPLPLVLVSVAAFLACCTWKSSARGSAVSSIWSSSQRHHRLFIKST